jgi:putative hemin transport protein
LDLSNATQTQLWGYRMSQPATIGHSQAHLKEEWANLHNDDPRICIRDAARQLGVSEAQLVATGCGETVMRLAGNWVELAKHLPLLGRIMALTRNEHAVHERQGIYRDVRVIGNICQVCGDGIDLRLSFAHWHSGFAVCEPTLSGPRRSLQFFDRCGNAVHKIYLTDDSDLATYDALISSYRSADQGTDQDIIAAPAYRPPTPDHEVDADGLRVHWDNLRDSHAFLTMLDQFGISRLQALRLAGGRRAYLVATSSLRLVLQWVCDLRLPIRVKVGNPGAHQIYAGPIHNARPVGNWYSVLDADFNLHVREAAIDSAWVVRRPTVEGAISGAVTSFELFDASGNTIACILGRRKPGIPEDLAWRRLVTTLEPL